MSHLNYLEKLLDGEIVEWIALGDVTLIKTGQAVSKQAISTNPGKYPVINSGKEPLGFIDKWNTDNDPIGITTRGAGVGSITWQEGKYFRGNLNYSVTIKDSANLEVRYLYHLLHQMQSAIQSLCTFDGIPALNAGSLKGLEIPIPCPDNPEKSLAIQAEIVRILDAFTAMTAELTAELSMRKKQYNYYRDQLLSFEEGEVEWKTLGDVFNIFAGGDKPKDAFSEEETEEFNVPILSNGIGLKSLYGWTNSPKITEPSLTVSARGTIGWTSYRDRPFFPIIRLIVLTPKIEVNTKYAYYYMKTIENNYPVPPAGIPQLTKPMIENVQFPIPYPNDPERSKAEQARIVAILDKFDALTNSITEGLPREIELRQKQYEYYRDLLLSFPKSHSDEAA
ncbi:restriction endonuclease subunit S [Vibrio furnissii]|uniref:restriction endonuclease subunit S n=1 Tax=Vibrio furnissii TaxID=29494 RepID=UPI0037478DA6